MPKLLNRDTQDPEKHTFVPFQMCRYTKFDFSRKTQMYSRGYMIGDSNKYPYYGVVNIKNVVTDILFGHTNNLYMYEIDSGNDYIYILNNIFTCTMNTNHQKHNPNNICIHIYKNGTNTILDLNCAYR